MILSPLKKTKNENLRSKFISEKTEAFFCYIIQEFAQIFPKTHPFSIKARKTN